MKHFLKFPLYAVALVAVSYLFYACSEEEPLSVSNVTQSQDFKVRVKNGYLEFKDQEAFDEVKVELEGKSREELDAWESQFPGFTSIRSMEEKAIDSQEEYFSQLEKISETELEILKKQQGDDFFYSEYLRSNQHLFEFLKEGIYNIKLPSFTRDMRGFINEKGLIKIGNRIDQYDNLTLKIIEDGDDSKVDLLPGILEHDIDQNILVYKLTEKIARLSNNAKMEFDSDDPLYPEWVCYGNTVSDYRVKGIIVQGHYPGPAFGRPSNWYMPYVTAIAESWGHKGIFGGWTKKRTSELVIDMNLTVQNATFQNNGTFNIYRDCGGNNTASIGGTVWTQGGNSNNPVGFGYGWETPFPFSFRIYGSSGFIGRFGSTCP